ncbi:MAG: hypothetical protein ACTHN5_11585 [Phycisphaerae bacterium]
MEPRNDLRIHLSICRDTGVPCASVPCASIWELVEHLARHRTRVHYSYGPTHFHVFFLNLDLPAARRLLEDWAAGAGQPEESAADARMAEALL